MSGDCYMFMIGALALGLVLGEMRHWIWPD